MAQGVQDDAIFIREDDVAVLARQLQDQLLGDDLPLGADQVHVQDQHPVQAVLVHAGDAPFLQVLAQQHAEGRGQVGPLGQGLRQGDERRIPAHVDEQVPGLVQGIHLQQQGRPAGHENLENLAAAQGPGQFPGEQLQGDSF